MVDSNPREAEVLALFDKLSNWGRWGPDDQLGTLNLISDDMRRQAALSVRTGQTFSLAWDIRPGIGGDPPLPPQRHMLLTGEGQHDDHRIAPPGFLGAGKIGFAVEHIGLMFHGPAITHLDALSHCFWDGQLYNGVPSATVTAFSGATRHDVTAARAGIVGRGVLLDSAGQRGLPLEPGESLSRHDLDELERAHGLMVGPGDIVLVHTGHDLRRIARQDPGLAGCPGLAPSCLEWLHERDVAVIGSDGANDPDPVPYEAISRPIHAIGIVAMGLWLLDNLRLDELADACRQANQHTFMFQLAPLAITGATGSPVNPIALL